MAQHLLIIVWKESIVRNHYFGKRFVGECTVNRPGFSGGSTL